MNNIEQIIAVARQYASQTLKVLGEVLGVFLAPVGRVLKRLGIYDAFSRWAEKVFAVRRLERQVALAFDVFVCVLLGVLPWFGWVVAAAYFLLRGVDLPKLGTVGIGKSLYGLKIAYTNGNDAPVPWLVVMVHNLALLLPLLNIVELYFFWYRDKRCVDRLFGIDVVKADDAADEPDQSATADGNDR